jgi:poly-gamma-glutamate capsule biosynthesis protein CapA/YwtB (metallophosphatase superfamily)
MLMRTILKLFYSIIFLNINLFAQPDSIIIVFGGDCTLSGHFEDYVKENYSYPFKKLNTLRIADIAMVNLENPISVRGKIIEKEFNFRMHPKYISILKDGGIDIVTSANNHVFDYGEDALYDTMRFLDSAGIKFVGIGKNIHDAREPVIFTVKNKKIAFLGYFGNGDWYPATKSNPGTAPRSKAFIEEDIKKLKGTVDYVIVNFHWGEESEEYPDEYQKDLAHFTIDAGADLIIGHHPHVLQGIEKYNKGIIAYSLGNFIFGGNGRKDYNSMLFKIKIIDDKIIPEILPIRIKNWQPYLLEGNDKEIIVKKVKKLSEIFINSIF